MDGGARDLERGLNSERLQPAEPSHDPEREDGAGIEPANNAETVENSGESDEHREPQVSLNISIWEFRPGPDPWKKREFTPDLEPTRLGDGVTVRLYLAEDTATATLEGIRNIQGVGVRQEFFNYHKLNDPPSDCSDFRDYFFIKWPRCLRQTPRQWKIEDRISSKRPWDLDSIIDPEKLFQDHNRYLKVKLYCRPHAPLEPKPTELSHLPAPVHPDGRTVDGNDGERERFQVMRENISYYFKRVDGGFIGDISLVLLHIITFSTLTYSISGIIICDAPPELEIEDRKYKFGKLFSNEKTRIPCFEAFEGCYIRFLNTLKHRTENDDNVAQAFEGNPAATTRDILLRFILDDHMEILPRLSLALDYIDENMWDNSILRSHLEHWRIFFGLWRKLLWHYARAFEYIINNCDLTQCACTIVTATAANNDGRYRDMRPEFATLAKDINNIKTRVDSTFTAIMSTMGIVESQKAIAQAETISQLTNLAFFFIPLTLTAGIFGMNIVVGAVLSSFYKHIPVILPPACDCSTQSSERAMRVNERVYRDGISLSNSGCGFSPPPSSLSSHT
ncbi:hypothetical protein GP486_007837 [Trichoglossum hirsutum]|uniref:Uncharacterized protein n=1 Tax=Trichoglossum hirsutum TaxID=265104 RepID=A0A9P8IC20_9PEZI|nr:hypothetical protein GP486_007837 [Trichoglossum hirsutum]